MLRKGLVAFALMAWAGSAWAASTDVVFKGGGVFTSTSGCTGWNPNKEFFFGTYWVPVAGSTNAVARVSAMKFGASSTVLKTPSAPKASSAVPAMPSWPLL